MILALYVVSSLLLGSLFVNLKLWNALKIAERKRASRYEVPPIDDKLLDEIIALERAIVEYHQKETSPLN